MMEGHKTQGIPTKNVRDMLFRDNSTQNTTVHVETLPTENSLDDRTYSKPEKVELELLPNVL